MLSKRREAILEMLKASEYLEITELASEFEVSAMTVRRDIEYLDGVGLAHKIRGGVRRVTTSEPAATTPADVRLNQQAPQKQAIARAAAALVKPGMSVGISSGSSSLYLAKELRDFSDLTIVTNSLDVGDELENELSHPAMTTQSVVLTGGIRTPARALVGPVAVRSLGELHCDIVFMSVHGMDPEAGITTPNIMEAETNRSFLLNSPRAVVLADHTKWRAVSLTTIAELEQVDTVITDSGISPAALKELRELVSEVIVAPVELV